MTVNNEDYERLLDRACKLEERVDKLESALTIMNSPDTDWPNGAIGVGYMFRLIASEAMRHSSKEEFEAWWNRLKGKVMLPQLNSSGSLYCYLAAKEG